MPNFSSNNDEKNIASMLQINQKIETERIKAGLTQDEMAEKLGIKRSTYQYWEKKTPGIDKLKQVARALGKPENYFLTDTDENIGKPEPDPATVLLPTGDVKRTLADYINMLELYNRTLTAAVNAGLIELRNDIKAAAANSAQHHELTQKQILHSSEWLAALMLEHKADLLKPPLNKDKGISQKKVEDGDGKGKGR
jgi:transcriptional regulator with XRE-family HTH domain